MALRDLFKTYREARKLQQGTLDTSGPQFEPVLGVDVDRYAQICARIAKANQDTALDEQGLDELLTSEGIDPSNWKQIADAWNERVMGDMAVKLRYTQTFMSQS